LALLSCAFFRELRKISGVAEDLKKEFFSRDVVLADLNAKYIKALEPKFDAISNGQS